MKENENNKKNETQKIDKNINHLIIIKNIILSKPTLILLLLFSLFINIVAIGISRNDTKLIHSYKSKIQEYESSVESMNSEIKSLKEEIYEKNIEISDLKNEVESAKPWLELNKSQQDIILNKINDMKAEEQSIIEAQKQAIMDIGLKLKEEEKENSKSQVKKININSLEYGKLLDVYQDDGLVIIKAKIDYAYSKKSTINQNGFNIEHIIEENNIDGIEEIQYWAVADMTDGSEEKVVSFTVNKSLINRVKNGSVAGAYIIDEASDVWIHPSLR